MLKNSIALLLGAVLIVGCNSELPDYGIEYRIDKSIQVGDSVNITYTIENSGEKDLKNVELEITLINDAGEYFIDLTTKNDIDRGDTETKETSIKINGTYTQSFIPGTSVPNNVYISGTWWDS